MHATLAGVQIIPLPTLANQILARTFFRFRLVSVCVPSRWKVLSGEFRRRPTALAMKFPKPDRVGRRGLSEPREDFSRLPTYAWTQKWFVQILGSGLICPRAQTCCALKSSAPSGARQTSTQTPARLANSPGFKSFRCPR